MIGILCEKPSAARNFAAALGGASGTFHGQSYKIAASHGHLYGYDDEPAHQVPPALKDRYSDWSIANLPWDETDFLWKYVPKDASDDTPRKIREAFSDCDEICIATDDDPTGEGELLAWEVLWQQNIRAKKYTRMFFEDEAPASIQKAFVTRKTLGTSLECMYDDPDFKQATFRTKWDYLSMQWSRIATRVNNVRGQVLRNGRLKSAMIVIVGDQLKLVDEYVKKPFYQNRFRDENGVVYTNKDEPTFDTKEQVPQTYHDSDVVLDSKTMKETAPPKMVDLASLSATLATKGIPAKTVLATYQAMYTDNIVSYPRTEDKYITEEQFNQLLPLVDDIARAVGVDPSLLTHREPRKTHIRRGMAHGANRPGQKVPDDIDALDAKYGKGAKEIYVLLARNYLATLCENYVYEQQKGHVSDYPKFLGTSNVPVSQGWKAIYDDGEKDENSEEESEKGLGKHADPFIYEGCNQKPAAPTMKWLMKQLEKRNVGTGATRASTYADVTNAKTKYPLLVEKRGKLSFADCGKANYQLLPGTHIGDLTVTERITAEMKDVAEGRKTEAECLHLIQEMIRDDIEVMKKNRGVSGASQESSGRERVTGAWKKCGREVTFSRTWGGYEFTDEQIQDLLDGKTIEFDHKSAYGMQHISGHLDNCEYKGRKFVGFAMDRKPSTSSTKKSEIPDAWSGHTFTESEKKDLKAGKAVHADDFYSSRTQKNYSTSVKWGKIGKIYKIVPEFSTEFKKLAKS